MGMGERAGMAHGPWRGVVVREQRVFCASTRRPSSFPPPLPRLLSLFPGAGAREGGRGDTELEPPGQGNGLAARASDETTSAGAARRPPPLARRVCWLLPLASMAGFSFAFSVWAQAWDPTNRPSLSVPPKLCPLAGCLLACWGPAAWGGWCCHSPKPELCLCSAARCRAWFRWF